MLPSKKLKERYLKIGKYTIKIGSDTSARGKAMSFFSICIIAQTVIGILVSFFYIFDMLFNK
jgi:hypothetical protein